MPVPDSLLLINYFTLGKDFKSFQQVVLAGDETKPDIYRVKFEKNDTPSAFIWIRDNKIGSFVAMGQGGKRVFIKFCP